MANTTNYNWETPDDTDLVKDGAAAIRTLGSSIDTTVFNNASAAIAKSIVDAKGDLIAATAADTVARLAVGTNGQILTADSTTATGLAWAAPASGGMSGLTLLNSGNTTVGTGTSKTWTGLSGYQNLIVNVTDITTGGAAIFRVEAGNGTSLVEWSWQGAAIGAGSTYTQSNFLSGGGGGTDFFMGRTSDGSVSGFFWLMNANATGLKYAQGIAGPTGGTAANTQVTRVIQGYESTAGNFAVSQLTIAPNTGNFSGGTVRIWGA